MQMIFRLPIRLGSAGVGLLGMMLVILSLSLAVPLIMMVMSPGVDSQATQVSAMKADILRNGILLYQVNHGGSTLPPTLDDLVTTDAVPCVADNNPADGSKYKTMQGWCGPYVDQVFQQNPNDFKTDGWGNLFDYDNTNGDITSLGPDGILGTADDIVYNL